jgi:predicted glycogen debranching enzyme
VIASTSPRSAADIHLLRESELSRREKLARRASPRRSGRQQDPFLRALSRACDQFLVARGEGSSVIAGYPWFSDWTRDAMVALPGLALATGRPEIAREILLEFGKHVREGMLPNRFLDEGGEPEYNAVDATLWYVEAIRAYVEATGDLALVGDVLYPVLEEVVASHVRGTRYGIRVDADGLLASGAAGLALTWMDARVDGRPVTPRRGKPVEIQALWFNALCTMRDLAREIGEEISSNEYETRAAACHAGFLRLFGDGGGGGLVDVVDDNSKDSSIRPNQLFAVSLHHSIVSPDSPLARRILAVVEEHLLTPFGLRTLSPHDPAYRGRYEGGPVERDSAYHQGTVWPWLLGPYVEAFLKAHGDGPEARARMRAVLEPLRAFILGDGLGHVPEIFDGDAPQLPRGCIAQAWSASELLRATILASRKGETS